MRAACTRVSPSPGTQPAQWRSRVGHAKAGCALEVTARTSHHGLARKERGIPPMRCPYEVQEATTASAARRARGNLACFATFRDTASAVALALRSHEGRLCAAGGHRSHVAPRSCIEGERPPAGVVPFHRTKADRNQRDPGAHAASLRVTPPPSRDSQRSGAGERATRMPASR